MTTLKTRLGGGGKRDQFAQNPEAEKKDKKNINDTPVKEPKESG